MSIASLAVKRFLQQWHFIFEYLNLFCIYYNVQGKQQTDANCPSLQPFR